MENKISTEVQEQIRKRFSKSPFFNLLKMEIKDLEKGKAVVAVKPQEQLLQSAGLMHGGVIATLCDVAVAVAVVTLTEPHANLVTVELKVNYLKPVKDNEIYACAEIIKKGKKIVVSDVLVIDKYGERYAAALATYALLDK